MKALNIIFWIATAGVVVSFGGAIFTVVKEHQQASVPHPVVTPAVLPPGT